jgi:hypothetical protein
MAKVQAKKAAAAAKKSSAKKAGRPTKLSARKPAKKATKKPLSSVKRTAKPSKPSKPAKAAKVPRKAAKAPAKAPAKASAKASAKSAPPKSASKAVSKAGRAESGKRTVKASKPVAKVAAVAAAIPAAPKASKVIAHKAAPAAGEASDKKRTRRARPRITSTGAAVANWFVQEKPRPSSFIPAPPRAEAPSLVAAPPASSDRLIRPEDLTHTAVRTVPVRIDVEQGGGRVFIAVSPIEVTLRPAEGIEWDFRYVGGADVIVDELIIEFDRPSPFGMATFRSKRPGAARPHRQLSGGAGTNSAGKRFQYTIRAMNAFKTELATARPSVHILLA